MAAPCSCQSFAPQHDIVASCHRPFACDEEHRVVGKLVQDIVQGCSETGEFLFAQATCTGAQLHGCFEVIPRTTGARQAHTIGHAGPHGVFFLEEQIVDDTLQLDVKQGVAV